MAGENPLELPVLEHSIDLGQIHRGGLVGDSLVCLEIDQRPVENRVFCRLGRIELFQPAGGEEVVVFDPLGRVLEAVRGQSVACVEVTRPVHDRETNHGAVDRVPLLGGAADQSAERARRLTGHRTPSEWATTYLSMRRMLSWST